jgi:hypothetical protein
MSKTSKCLKCKSENTTRIVYGFPDSSSLNREDMFLETVVSKTIRLYGTAAIAGTNGMRTGTGNGAGNSMDAYLTS